MQDGLIQHDDQCLSMPNALHIGAPILLQQCEDASRWKLGQSSLIESRDKVGLCISASPHNSDIVSAICDPDDYLQKFIFN
jgi:hypothetical protein